MIGTFDYMSPEQLVGGELTPASDLYTLGVVMYEMIAGVRPYAEVGGPASMLGAVLTRKPAPLGSRCEVPAELEAVIMRCIAVDADHRFQSADELDAALERAGEPEAVTRVLVAPRLPLPAPPLFEARGSDAGISKPRFETVEQAALRRFTWMLAILIAAVIAFAIAATA